MSKPEESYKWLEAITTVRFDLEEGQMVDYIFPPLTYPDKFNKLIGYFSFPDSYVFPPEGELFYTFQLVFEGDPLYCYSHFTQKKDPTNPRGYFQKSVVLVSKLRLVKIFKVVLKEINKLYFARGEDESVLEECFLSINNNESPLTLIKPFEKFIVKLMEQEIKVRFKRVFDTMFRLHLRCDDL